MSRNDGRLCFSPEVYENKSMSDLLKNSFSADECGREKLARFWGFRLSKNSKYYAPVLFLRDLKTKVTKSICVASKRKSSGKVSSSNLARCRSVSDPIESHRAEALEDCIEFLNSSASLIRTNSVSSNY